MASRTLDVKDFLQPEGLACSIANRERTWRAARSKKEQQWQELRNYIFATDTTTTTNASLPWKNKTTRPKLCQIRDNLHANYMAALFPNDRWFKWDARDRQATNKDKAKAIEAYMGTKLRDMKFKNIVSRLLYDFIDYGNSFADVEYVDERRVVKEEPIDGYVGPRVVRISPYDILFDITASSFEQAPKITRTLYSIGDLHKRLNADPQWSLIADGIIGKLKTNRGHVLAYRNSDYRKSDGFVADGFGTLADYYGSGLVEILEFEGDLYDDTTGQLYEDYYIVVVDRAYVIHKEPISNWFGRSTKQHCGWRLRPDNLMAMGPLDNLVGLQYRIDHLENLKADVFDQIAHPITKVRGYVEEFQFGPGERIYMDTDADVDFLRPDSAALSANFDIDRLEAEMEEMAGAPKQAMGIRTPGEKTAFEVQTLENATGRIFQHKIAYFEEHFIEPLLNAMLEVARRNIDASELVRVVDDDLGVVEFRNITRDDLKIRGKLVPMGARHFAAQNLLVQNLTTLSGTATYQDPMVNIHFSGYAMAKLLEENMGFDGYNIVQKNIRIAEQAEAQRQQIVAQQETEEHAITPTDVESNGGAAIFDDQEEDVTNADQAPPPTA